MLQCSRVLDYNQQNSNSEFQLAMKLTGWLWPINTIVAVCAFIATQSTLMRCCSYLMYYFIWDYDDKTGNGKPGKFDRKACYKVSNYPTK